MSHREAFEDVLHSFGRDLLNSSRIDPNRIFSNRPAEKDDSGFTGQTNDPMRSVL